MGFSRKRTLLLVLFVALTVLSLRPDPRLERALGWLFVPARVLAELGLPIGWLRASEVSAAEAALARGLAREREASTALVLLERASARPRAAELCAARTLLQAEVVGRPRERRDRVEIELGAAAEPEVGLPVVRGDHYVGRVHSVLPTPPGAPRRALVDLVTGSSFRIGARVLAADGGAGSGLVVGGLAPAAASGNALLLAAHKPSDRRVATGRVVVDDVDALEPGGFARLADGYALGELVRVGDPPAQVLAVRAGLDFKDGLSGLVVLAPAEPGGALELELARDPFDERDWTWADVAFPGAPSFWREGRKLEKGTLDGVRDGAAVLFGARLCGRVVRAHALSSDVALLGDRGLELTALAQVEGRLEPLPLGRLVVQGRDARGRVRLAWDALVPFDGAAPAPAQLFTGSGLAGVPLGLYVGTTLLPPGPGPHELALETAAGIGDLSRVQVRRERASEDRSGSLSGEAP